MAASEVFRAGPQAAIAAAILELISVTSRPPSIDDAKELAYQEGLCRAMWDYPIDVVENACRNWRRVPGHGKWWPSEQDLRAQCETLVQPRNEIRAEAEMLLRTMEARQGRGDTNRSLEPIGRTKAFYEAAMAARGPDFCRSWLSGRTCEFNDTTIFTHGLGVERLTQTCGPLMILKGVKAVRCQHVTQRFYAEEDARAELRGAPRKRKA